MTNTSATGGYIQPTSALPLDDAALDTLLQALVVGITGLPGNLVRPRWQPVAPKQPDASVDWCAVGVMDYDAESNISITHDGTGLGQSTSYQNETLDIQASFYGPTARGNASLLRDGLMIAQNRELLSLQEISLKGQPGRAIRAPELVNQQWINRVDLPFTLSRRIVRIWPIENILGINATATTDDDAQTAIITVP